MGQEQADSYNGKSNGAKAMRMLKRSGPKAVRRAVLIIMSSPMHGR